MQVAINPLFVNRVKDGGLQNLEDLLLEYGCEGLQN
jgi:hypothetical protein